MQTELRARAGAGRRTLGMGVVVALVAALLAIVGLSGPAAADIVSPAADSVIRDSGPVTIAESPGGANGFLCSGANTTIVVTRPDTSVALTKTKGGAGAYSAVWDTSTEAPGMYTIKSTVTNRPRVGFSCQTQVVTDEITVEYRPWQHGNFHDLLGHGRVGVNVSPPEFQFTVDGTSSPVIAGTRANMAFFGSSIGLDALPADLGACVADLSNCLPPDALACVSFLNNPDAGCTPRLVWIFHEKHQEQLWGLFDLESGAFVAMAQAGGKVRVLASAGTDIDAIVADLLADVAASGEEVTGIDLVSLLSSTVQLTVAHEGRVGTLEVGVLRGLQYSQLADDEDATTRLDLLTPYAINAGFITHSVAPHTFAEADGDPSVFTVTQSPLVPNLPTLFSVPLGGLGSLDLLLPVPVPAPLNEVAGDLLLVGGGPLVNIHGTYPDGTGSHTAGTSATGPSVDTTAGAPSGVGAWVPGLDGDTIADTGPIDFLGHAALFLDLPQFCLLGTCLDTGSLLIGQGVTIFGDSPLPPLASLPLLWDTDNPAAAELNELTSNLALELLTNPAVGEVLTAALALLGGEVPDLDGVTEALSDMETVNQLIEAVSGAAGLDAVPGLEDTINDLGVPTSVSPIPGATAGDPWTELMGGLRSLLGF